MTFENEERQQLIVNHLLGRTDDISESSLNEAYDDRYSEDIEKINRYKDYIDLLSSNYLVGLNQLRKEKDSKAFIDYQERFQKNGKINFLNDLEPYLSSIPKSNGSRYFKKLKFRVGIVSDEFLFNSYKDVTEMTYIPYDYTSIDTNFDFVIIATTWNGVDGSWKGVANDQSDQRTHLYGLIHLLKAKNIPVVFYSKEDPVNYDLFKNIAKECDFIYTSAREMVDIYKAFCNTERVSVLEFGINPHYHNPVGTRSPISRKKKDEVIFAGSWIEKYPVRNNEAKKIFEAIIDNETELTIIDRNLHLNRSRYHFPAQFIPQLTYPMSHEQLQLMHKVFRWAINVNSVKYSETMFANRIYELQAFGNLILSNYSVGVNNKFPNIMMLNSEKDFAAIYNHLSERELNELQAKGIRNVMRSETTYHRMTQIAEDLQLEAQEVLNKPVYVIADITSDSVKEQFEHQNYTNKILLSQHEFDELVLTEDAFVTHFINDYYYEEYYLEDMVSAFKYVDVDFVTKIEDESKHHDYITAFEHGKTMFDAAALSQEQLSGYALDTSELLRHSELPVASREPKELSVIIPIHNNGIYLEDKCMASLKRSSLYNKMEIIFVNDGSTDPLTNQIINRLRRQNPSIVYYEFEKGSGSASRPRNKGAELASTPFITYLDPDNEATGDGYYELLEQMKLYPDVDIVIGNIIKEDNERRSLFNYYKTVLKYNHDEPLISDTHQFMKASGLRAQSIQALIVKSHIIKDHQIRMVEGAAGQDTMFFQELMLASRKALVIEENIHMYYAAVSGSVTNTVSKKFFDKYYILELERIPFLKKHHLLQSYLDNRFNFYIRGWYLVRLERVAPEERAEAVTRFLDIYSLYDDYERPENKDLNEIIDNLKKEVQYTKNKVM